MTNVQDHVAQPVFPITQHATENLADRKLEPIPSGAVNMEVINPRGCFEWSTNPSGASMHPGAHCEKYGIYDVSVSRDTGPGGVNRTGWLENFNVGSLQGLQSDGLYYYPSFHFYDRMVMDCSVDCPTLLCGDPSSWGDLMASNTCPSCIDTDLYIRYLEDELDEGDDMIPCGRGLGFSPSFSAKTSSRCGSLNQYVDTCALNLYAAYFKVKFSNVIESTEFSNNDHLHFHLHNVSMFYVTHTRRANTGYLSCGASDKASHQYRPQINYLGDDESVFTDGMDAQFYILIHVCAETQPPSLQGAYVQLKGRAKGNITWEYAERKTDNGNSGDWECGESTCSGSTTTELLDITLLENYWYDVPGSVEPLYRNICDCWTTHWETN